MICTKGKRKLIFRGQVFYWYINKDETGYPCITVFSQDKKLRLSGPLMDRESIGSARDARDRLEAHLIQFK